MKRIPHSVTVSVLGFLATAFFLDYRQQERLEEFSQQQQAIVEAVQEIQQALKIPGTNVAYTKSDERCLAKNIFHEAGVESYKGKLAVGQVTINRVETGRWGDTICDVVYAPAQFSWTLDPKLVEQDPRGELWDESVKAAKAILAGRKVKELAKAKFYHTDYIRTPFWADKKAKIGQLGQHIFYEKAKLKEEPKLAKLSNKKQKGARV